MNSTDLPALQQAVGRQGHVPHALWRELIYQCFPGAFPFRVWGQHVSLIELACVLFLYQETFCSSKIPITQDGCKGKKKKIRVAFHIDLETN